jgi:cation:H+ antiporter
LAIRQRSIGYVAIRDLCSLSGRVPWKLTEIMLISISLIIVGFLLLIAGGEALLRGAVGLATLLRLTPAVVGLTVVAAGTSVPELAVSVLAALRDSPDIAVGNVVGSNIFNIAIILPLCALLRPIPIVGNTIRLEFPVLLIVTLMCVAVSSDGTVGRLDGGLFIATYALFTAYLIRLVRHQATADENRGLAAEVAELTPTPQRPRGWVCVTLVAVGAGLLAGGAQATVVGAVDLARAIGMSERVIGLTIVAVGTSLPEIVASVMSGLRGRADIAVGNVIGSNIFNILGILGLSSIVSPLPVSEAMLASDFWWMLGVTAVLFPMLLTGRQISRLEGFGLLAVYGVYLALLLRT